MFDGVCNFCNGTVNFIIKRDRRNVFSFAALQSETGKRILSDNGVRCDLDTFFLVEGGKIFQKSSAALRVMRHLRFYKMLFPLILIPVFVRDFFYDLIARNRYRWFGKRDVCMIPDERIKSKFID